MEKIQQGDVLINRITDLPSGVVKIDKKTRGYVLAEGETTGHAHVVNSDDVEMYERNGVLYLSVMEAATLVHEEHSSIVLEPGTYEIGIVQEVDPFTEQIRKVID